ncbi:MAG: helix-turn-helix transcriptional regulator [Tenericutes bacterium]|nr:helix-turn-helix transcriptional regulator [Mycoplasmatota bacterium]
MINNLGKILKEKKISAKKVSDATHIDVSTLSKMKNFERSISQENALVLADFFKISIDELFGRKFLAQDIDLKIKKMSYEEVIFKLDELDNKDLLSLSGAIDYLLMTRNEKAFRNKDENIFYKTIK